MYHANQVGHASLMADALAGGNESMRLRVEIVRSIAECDSVAWNMEN